MELRIAQIQTPHAVKKLEFVETASGERISAGTFVFCCGGWLGKVFPEVLAGCIFPTRQEVFFLAFRRAIRGLLLPRCQHGCFRRMRCMGCRILNVAA